MISVHMTCYLLCTFSHFYLLLESLESIKPYSSRSLYCKYHQDPATTKRFSVFRWCSDCLSCLVEPPRTPGWTSSRAGRWFSGVQKSSLDPLAGCSKKIKVLTIWQSLRSSKRPSLQVFFHLVFSSLCSEKRPPQAKPTICGSKRNPSKAAGLGSSFFRPTLTQLCTFWATPTGTHCQVTCLASTISSRSGTLRWRNSFACESAEKGLDLARDFAWRLGWCNLVLCLVFWERCYFSPKKLVCHGGDTCVLLGTIFLLGLCTVKGRRGQMLWDALALRFFKAFKWLDLKDEGLGELLRSSAACLGWRDVDI